MVDINIIAMQVLAGMLGTAAYAASGYVKARRIDKKIEWDWGQFGSTIASGFVGGLAIGLLGNEGLIQGIGLGGLTGIVTKKLLGSILADEN